MPFHPHKGTATQERNILKFLIIKWFLWEAGTVQEKKWIEGEEQSQSSQTLTTRANVTSSQSLWKNVKSCTFLEEDLTTWKESGPQGPNVICAGQTFLCSSLLTSICGSMTDHQVENVIRNSTYRGKHPRSQIEKNHSQGFKAQRGLFYALPVVYSLLHSTLAAMPSPYTYTQEVGEGRRCMK